MVLKIQIRHNVKPKYGSISTGFRVTDPNSRINTRVIANVD